MPFFRHALMPDRTVSLAALFLIGLLAGTVFFCATSETEPSTWLWWGRRGTPSQLWRIAPVADGARWWSFVNGNVMGGRSTATLTNAPDGLLFSGNVNVDGGGFASCRAKLTGSLAGARGVAVTARRVAGGTTRSKVLLKSPGRGTVWQSDLQVPDDGRPTTVYLPFAGFLPHVRDEVVGRRGIPSNELPNLSEVGVMISFLDDRGKANQPGFVPGDFGLLVQDVAAYQ